MKKTIIIIAALLSISSAAAYAQEDNKDTKELLKRIEEMEVKVKKHKSLSFGQKPFSEFSMLSYSGYGFNFVKGSETFNPWLSREIVQNVFEVNLHPTGWLSFNAGFDLKWNKFTSKEKIFDIDGGKFVPSVMPKLEKSTIRTFSLAVPASMGFSIGKFELRLGVEGVKNINKYTSVRSKYSAGNSDYTRKTKGGEVERYQLNYQGSLLFNKEIGIYYKYCPKQLVPGNDMIKQYQTIGIIAFL